MQDEPNPEKYSLHRAVLADAKRLGAILGDAFDQDPVLRWITPKGAPTRRFFALEAKAVYLPSGLCWIAGEDGGAAMWLPPGEEGGMPSTLETFWVFLPALLRNGLAPSKRADELSRVFARHRPKEPHYYLHAIGARQAMQGRGIGSALLRAGLAEVDAHHQPAYLESSNPRNVPLYQRYGFEVQAEEQFGGGPTVAFMWRPPR